MIKATGAGSYIDDREAYPWPECVKYSVINLQSLHNSYIAKTDYLISANVP